QMLHAYWQWVQQQQQDLKRRQAEDPGTKDKPKAPATLYATLCTAADLVRRIEDSVPFLSPNPLQARDAWRLLEDTSESPHNSQASGLVTWARLHFDDFWLTPPDPEPTAPRRPRPTERIPLKMPKLPQGQALCEEHRQDAEEALEFFSNYVLVPW